MCKAAKKNPSSTAAVLVWGLQAPILETRLCWGCWVDEC